MSERFSAAKYTIVLAHDNITKAVTDLVDALIKDEQGSIGSRLLDAERRLNAALRDIRDAFNALERK